MQKVLAALISILPALCLADAQFRFETEGETSAEALYSVKDGKVLMQDVNRTTHAVLFDANAEELTMIDHEQRNYMVLDRATVGEAADKLAAARAEVQAQLEQQLASIPEEQRKLIIERQMPAWLNEPTQPQVSIEDTGSTDTIAGFRCRMVRVLEDGVPAAEGCLAHPDEMGLAREDFDTVTALFDALREMASKLGPGITIPNLHAEGGMPILYRDLVDGNVSTFKDVSTDELDAALFVIPADYERQTPTF